MEQSTSHPASFVQPSAMRLLRNWALNPHGPFYRFVLTYLVASAGLTPVYDQKNYPNFLDGVAGVFPGTEAGDARIELSECVGLARGAALPQRLAEVSLCSMLANTAYESMDANDRTRLKGNPAFEVFRHVRNAASHGNSWHFFPREPSVRGEWKRIVIDDARKGDANPLQGTACFYGSLHPADLLYLLRDVEKLLT